MYFPRFRCADPVRCYEPFDDKRFIFELKYDGFRALACITPDGCQVVSRRGDVYKSFRPLRESLASIRTDVVLDGEIAVLDGTGRPQFYDLLRRRGEPIFYAFDCLWYQGQDLRPLPLITRKGYLRKVVEAHPRVLLAQHIERDGRALFKFVCERDLGGIVAKRKDGAYGEDWFKIRNPSYSQ